MPDKNLSESTSLFKYFTNSYPYGSKYAGLPGIEAGFEKCLAIKVSAPG